MRVEPVAVAGDPPVRGGLHLVTAAAADGLVLTTAQAATWTGPCSWQSPRPSPRAA